MDIFQEMQQAGVEIDNHESDLYVPVTDVTRAIVARFEFKQSVTTFQNQITGTLWYDIPFAYTPFWESKQAIAAKQEARPE
jgi:hypothetical protein